MTTVPTLHLPSPDLASRTRALFVQAGTPKYGCLMAMLPSLESVIPNWAADNIDAKTLANDGVEHETHCTVLYGWNTGFDSSRLKSILAGHPSIVLTVGKLSRFECPDYDVIKFAVESPALVKLNRDLSRQFKHCITASEHKFNAHITAAYVQKETNLDLTAPRIEGYSTVVQQLLYSLPDEKRRTVFDLGRNTTATLATRIKNLLRATESPAINAQSKQHAAARLLAQNRYQQAVDDFIAHAKAEAMSRDKKRREKIKVLWLLLMLDAGEDAYSLIYPKLAAITTPGTAKLAPPVKSEPADFAASRQTYLDNFSNTVLDRLDAVVQQGAHDAATPREIRRQLDERASQLRTGQGEVVATAESQACYGHAQIRILKRAGFKTALWDQIDRPTKRETHAVNMEMGPQPLGTLYPNGQRCPGDPAGGPGECLNCLCTLVGVDRSGSTVQAHDVSGEPRDYHGRWAKDGEKPLKQTETQEFKSWFKESKVIDADGKPLRVFHGAVKTFDEFSDKEKRGDEKNQRDGTYYFTTSPRLASEYTLENPFMAEPEKRTGLMQVKKEELPKATRLKLLPGLGRRSITLEKSENGKYSVPDEFLTPGGKLKKHASIQVELPTGHSIWNSHYDFSTPEKAIESATEIYNKPGGYFTSESQVLPVHLSLQNPLMIEGQGTSHFNGVQLKDGRILSVGQLIDEAKRKGHDGLMVKNITDAAANPARAEKQTTIVAFHPTQIKSAIGNSGKFDSNDPKITSSEMEAV